MLYTVSVLLAGAVVIPYLLSEFARRPRLRARMDGWSGALAWVSAEMLLILGVWSFDARSSSELAPTAPSAASC